MFRWIFKAGVQILRAKLSSKYTLMESFVSYLSQIRETLTFVLLKALFHCVAPLNDSQLPLKHFPDLAALPSPLWLYTNQSTFHSLLFQCTGNQIWGLTKNFP